jgi:hypothetical protein
MINSRALLRLVDDPIFANTGSFVFNIFLVPIAYRAFRRNKFDDQVGSAVNVGFANDIPSRSLDKNDVRDAAQTHPQAYLHISG